MKNIPRTMTNTKFKIDDHSEVVNMCEAIQGLINDGIAEGVVKGVKEEKRETALRLSNNIFPTYVLTHPKNIHIGHSTHNLWVLK